MYYISVSLDFPKISSRSRRCFLDGLPFEEDISESALFFLKILSFSYSSSGVKSLT